MSTETEVKTFEVIDKNKKYMIDVPGIIKKYNSNNPEKREIDRFELADILDMNHQNLTDWNNKPASSMIGRLLKLMEIHETEKLKDILIITVENGVEKISINIEDILKIYNAKNPDKRKFIRKTVADIIGINHNIFSKWKIGKTPSIIGRLLKLMEVAGTDNLKDILKDA